MRRGALLLLLLLFAFLTFAIHLVWNLLGLLFVDGSDDMITKAELPAPGSSRVNGRSQLIPKIIHQTYKNASIPVAWQDAQQSCLDLHQPEDGWEYKLWTDDKMEEFIRAEYPWFTETFEGYPYGIQRADTIRYFVLAHFGGVYIDFDDGCNRALEPLLSYPAWVRKTVPTGISNDAMGSVPEHPFFMRVIDELQNYDKNWLLPYITVMGSTGPLFLSVIWRRYSAEGLNHGDGADGGRVRIIFPDEYQGNSWSFFTHHTGNSWHRADVKLIFWVSFPHPRSQLHSDPTNICCSVDGTQLGLSNHPGLHSRRQPHLPGLVDLSKVRPAQSSGRCAQVEVRDDSITVPVLEAQERAAGV